MSKGMLRLVGIAIPVVALALGNAAFAQEKKPAEPPKTPEAKKPEAKPEAPKAEPKKEEPKAGADKTVLLTIAGSKDHTILADLVKTADLAKELEGVTVFAPTDEAFKKLGNVEDLKKDKAKLANILKGHIVKGKVELKGELKPLAGDPIKVEAKDGKTTLNGKINVVGKEIAAANGAVYVIDGVIAPAAAPAAAPAEKKPEAAPAPVKPEEKKPEPKKEEPKKEEPKKEEPKKP